MLEHSGNQCWKNLGDYPVGGFEVELEVRGHNLGPLCLEKRVAAGSRK